MHDLNAKSAIVSFLNYLKNRAKQFDFNSQNIKLLTPDDSINFGYGKCWSILWEEGPYNWAINISLGVDIFSKQQNTLLLNNKNFIAEPYNSYVLGFYDN